MKNINRITVINIISTFMIQGIAFVTIPIFTKMLGTDQYGLYSLFNSWVIMITCIMGFSMHSAIGTGYYTFGTRYTSFRNSILCFSTLICFGEILVIFLLMQITNITFGFDNKVIILILFTAFGHYIVGFVQTTYIYEKKAIHNLILSISLSVSTVVLSIIFIKWFSDDFSKYLGRIYGMAIPYVIISIIIWIQIFAPKPTKLYKEFCMYGISVGFPIVFHSLSQTVLGHSDRIMMQLMNINNSDIGIYSFYYSFCAVLLTILTALNNSWCPFFYDDINDGKWKELNNKCKNYVELFTVLCIGFIMLAREVSYMMSDKTYNSGVNLIPILVLATYFTFMYQFPVNFEFFYKKTNIIAIGTIGAGVINILLNALLIPKFGIYGALLATALAYLALFVAHYIIVKRMIKFEYKIKMKSFMVGLFFVIIAIFIFYILSGMWYVRWGTAIVIGLIEIYRIYTRKSIF